MLSEDEGTVIKYGVQTQHRVFGNENGVRRLKLGHTIGLIDVLRSSSWCLKGLQEYDMNTLSVMTSSYGICVPFLP